MTTPMDDRTGLRGASAADGRPLRVLVAEDDGPLQRAIVSLLQFQGHRTHTVATGDEFREALLRDPAVDLVITDLLMPGGGGRAVLEAVRDCASGIPVIVMTGNADEKTLEELAGLGACCCLRKPFSLDELVGAMAAAVAPREH